MFYLSLSCLVSLRNLPLRHTVHNISWPYLLTYSLQVPKCISPQVPTVNMTKVNVSAILRQCCAHIIKDRLADA